VRVTLSVHPVRLHRRARVLAGSSDFGEAPNLELPRPGRGMLGYTLPRSRDTSGSGPSPQSGRLITTEDVAQALGFPPDDR
jgi:hypothetical protein